MLLMGLRLAEGMDLSPPRAHRRHAPDVRIIRELADLGVLEDDGR